MLGFTLSNSYFVALDSLHLALAEEVFNNYEELVRKDGSSCITNIHDAGGVVTGVRWLHILTTIGHLCFAVWTVVVIVGQESVRLEAHGQR